MLVLLILGLGAAGCATAGWHEKPFTAWTRGECLRVLSASPWTKLEILRFVEPSGDAVARPLAPSAAGSGAAGGWDRTAPEPGATPTVAPGLAWGLGTDWQEVDGHVVRLPLRITWIAQPTRQAHSRLEQFWGFLLKKEYARLASRGNPDTIQFALTGRVLTRLVEPEDRRIAEQSRLVKKSGGELAPSRVLFRTSLDQPEIIIAFPSRVDGAPAVSLADEEVVLFVPLGERRLSVRFRLRELTIGGKLYI